MALPVTPGTGAVLQSTVVNNEHQTWHIDAQRQALLDAIEAGPTGMATASGLTAIVAALTAGVSTAPLLPSGVVPVIESFTAVGETDALVALAGRAINVTITGNSTGLSARLERQFEGDTQWLPITASGFPYAVWTANCSEQAWVEGEYGTSFRVSILAIGSGTATVRISQ